MGLTQFFAAHPHGLACEFDAVEFAGVVEYGFDAVLAHVATNSAHHFAWRQWLSKHFDRALAPAGADDITVQAEPAANLRDRCRGTRIRARYFANVQHRLHKKSITRIDHDVNDARWFLFAVACELAAC